MQNQPVARQPVLMQLPSGLYLGLVCYNPQFENLKFVLEKREFFEMEWPALVITQEKGLLPFLLGIPYFTVQRAQIIWYTTHIPAELLNYYQSFIPILKEPGLPGEAKPQPKAKAKKESDKIIPFPLRKDQGG
jgi:hypothetical protein